MCSLIPESPVWQCFLAHTLNLLVISNCPSNFRIYRQRLRVLCDGHEASIEMHWVCFIVVLPLKRCWHESSWKVAWSYARKASCFFPPGKVGVPWEILSFASVRKEGTDPACDVRPTRTTILFVEIRPEFTVNTARLANLFCLEDLFRYIPGIPTTTMQPRNSPGENV